MKLSDLKAHVAKTQKNDETPSRKGELIEQIDSQLLDNVAGAIGIWGRWGMAFVTNPA